MSIAAPVTLGRLRLSGPVLAAAGSFGPGAGPIPASATATAAAPDPESERLGAVVTSGITWRGRRGRAPRLLETPAGAVYVAGTAALGMAPALARHARSWAASPSPVVVSLFGQSGGDLGQAAAELEGLAGVVAVELDLTGPDGPIGDGYDRPFAGVRQAVAEVGRACALPILVKLPVTGGDPDVLLDQIAAAGSAGASAVTLGGGLPAASGVIGAAEVDGRLVGPATFPIVLALVVRVARAAALPMIVGGGIATTAHARAYLRAGAAAIQIGSAHLADPRAALDIQADLA